MALRRCRRHRPPRSHVGVRRLRHHGTARRQRPHPPRTSLTADSADGDGHVGETLTLLAALNADLESLLSSLADEVIDGNADEGLGLLADLGVRCHIMGASVNGAANEVTPSMR